AARLALGTAAGRDLGGDGRRHQAAERRGAGGEGGGDAPGPAAEAGPSGGAERGVERVPGARGPGGGDRERRGQARAGVRRGTAEGGRGVGGGRAVPGQGADAREVSGRCASRSPAATGSGSPRWWRPWRSDRR